MTSLKVFAILALTMAIAMPMICREPVEGEEVCKANILKCNSISINTTAIQKWDYCLIFTHNKYRLRNIACVTTIAHIPNWDSYPKMGLILLYQ